MNEKFDDESFSTMQYRIQSLLESERDCRAVSSKMGVHFNWYKAIVACPEAVKALIKLLVERKQSTDLNTFKMCIESYSDSEFKEFNELMRIFYPSYGGSYNEVANAVNTLYWLLVERPTED
jgi:hypothetical protein